MFTSIFGDNFFGEYLFAENFFGENFLCENFFGKYFFGEIFFKKNSRTTYKARSSLISVYSCRELSENVFETMKMAEQN